MRRRQHHARRRLQPALPAGSQLGLHDARPALRLHCGVRQRTSDLGRGVRRRQQGLGRRLLRRLQDRRARLAMPRARQEVRPAVRRRRADRHREVRRRQRGQRRRLLQHLFDRAGRDLSDAWPAVHQIGVRQRQGRGRRDLRLRTAGDLPRCTGPNGLFNGDGTGCSKTCTKEPICRDATGAQHTRARPAVATATSRPGEDCDDGNLVDGDGCSSTVQGRGRLHLHARSRSRTPRPARNRSDTGECLELPITYRDFKNETLAGGHPDFFFYGATITDRR